MKKLLWMIFEKETGQRKPLKKAARKLKIKFKVKTANFFKFEGEQLLYKNKPVAKLPSIVLLRCGIGIEFELHAFFAKFGIRVIDNVTCHHNCDDKIVMHNLLTKNKIKQPKIVHSENKITYEEVEKTLGSVFVAKDRFGQQGRGVFLISNKEEFENAVSQFEDGRLFFQEYIEQSRGKDLRTYIVGDDVIGAVMRISNSDFRSNVALGAKPAKFELTQPQADNSLKIAKILNGEIVSVDYLIKNNELLFCEANTNAGITSFVELGFPVAEKIMQYVLNAINKLN